MLQGVAGFVRSNAHRRQRIGVMHLRREPQRARAWVIMVGQMAAGPFARHIGQPDGVEDFPGGLRAG